MAITTDREASKQSLAGGQLLVALSGAVVTLFRECTGKGPEHCKAHWAGENTLVVLLGGGFTGVERTLFQAGHGETVQAQRRALHDSLAQRLTDAVERLAGRRVVAFMSASHQEPDLMAEIFVLEPDLAPRAQPPEFSRRRER